MLVGREGQLTYSDQTVAGWFPVGHLLNGGLVSLVSESLPQNLRKKIRFRNYTNLPR